MNRRISVALLWSNYGPYHVARAKALAERQELEWHFIELTGSDETHPWAPATADESFRLLSLSKHALPPRRAARMVTQELSRLDPDVVVSCYAPREMRVASVWARQRGKGSIAIHESTLIDRPRYLLKELVKRRIVLTHFDAAFVTGIRAREYLTTLGMPIEKIWEGYSAVDNDYFARAASEVRCETHLHRVRLGVPERYFLFVGRLAPEKNLPRLLQAYGSYHRRNPEGFGLVVVGDGPKRKELQRLASELRLTDVRWPGFLHAEELPAYYGLAECLVLPSTSEPWGLVVNEAMACGLPVMVSSHCGCVPELVRPDQNGFVFNPHNVSDIAALLERFSRFGEAERRQRGAISTEIVSKYTPTQWARNLAECVQVVAKNAQASRRDKGVTLSSLTSPANEWQGSAHLR
jgi:1,2-diacylglycerol 3-alpha-glucosyltransferase